MIIREEDRKVIKDFFSNELIEPVSIVMFTQAKSSLIVPTAIPCEWCEETEQLIKELAELSDKIKIEIYDFAKDVDKREEYKVDKIPALVIRNGEDYGIRFYGIPSGYEFGSLVEGIRDVSRKSTELSDATKNRLKDVKKDVHIQVFITPT
jgi:glutaredoxin-like protein